jgi:hypothetical protein
MATKLTLSAERDLVRKIKRFAREQGTSVSAIFDRFARTVTSPPKKPRRVGPLTQKASGVISLPKGKTDRQLIEDVLSERYGL